MLISDFLRKYQVHPTRILHDELKHEYSKILPLCFSFLHPFQPICFSYDFANFPILGMAQFFSFKL